MKPPDKIYCPVCKSYQIDHWATAKDQEYHSTDDEYDYYFCRDCITIFIYPAPEDQLSVIYPSNYYSFDTSKKNWAFKIKEWLDKFLFKKILRQIKSNSIHVLDVGGGTGWLCDNIKKIDARVRTTQIVDIDSNAKYIAEEKGHLYFEGKIEDFETNDKFDLVLLLNLLEHVAKPGEVLKKVEKNLKSGGIVLIKTPNIDSLDAKLFRKKYWGGLHCPRHWIIFSKSSFKRIIIGTDLKIANLQYTQGGPFWAFSLIALFSKKGWLKVDQQRPIIFHPLFPFISAAFAAFDFIRRPFAKTSQMFIVLKK